MKGVEKVNICPCGGVGLVLSSVARHATYLLTEELLPGKTEIVDSVGLYSGSAEEVALIEDYPTIVIDGCAHHCGTNLFRVLGIKPAARIFLPPIAKMPPSYVCECRKDEIKLSPGTNRRVLKETGKNLATEVATQAANIALDMINSDYKYEKQKINISTTPLCDYIEDVTNGMNYIFVNEKVEQPESMPKISNKD